MKPNNDSRNIAIDRALTLMLSNIAQFAPMLYADFILDKKTKEPKNVERHKIPLKDKKVVKEGKKDVIKDDDGNYDRLELKDDMIPKNSLMKVRIETPTTSSNLRALQKAQFNEMINGLLAASQISPQIAQKI